MKYLLTVVCCLATLVNFGLSAHNSDHHNDFPMARFLVTPDLGSETFGISAIGEIGPRSYRGNGTIGFALDECQLVKFSGEYLGEKFRYNFNRGCDRERRWVQQWAVGGEYEALICSCYLDSLSFGAAYSRAPSKNLSTIVVSDFGSLTRHIAGSKYWDVFAGATLTPWECASLYFNISYDDIRYDRRFHSDKHLRGVGGEFALTQHFISNVDVTIHGAVKRPYREIGAIANWTAPFDCQGWGLGVFVDYVQGRDRLPNSTVAGVQIGYSFGLSGCCQDVCQPDPCCGSRMRTWVSTPAVYRPTVFAIHESESLAACNVGAPTSTTVDLSSQGFFMLPNGDFSFFVPIMLADFSPFFTENGGTYTIAFDGTSVSGSIDPITGIATLNDEASIGPTDVIVTVTNCAGSTTQVVPFDMP